MMAENSVNVRQLSNKSKRDFLSAFHTFGIDRIKWKLSLASVPARMIPLLLEWSDSAQHQRWSIKDLRNVWGKKQQILYLIYKPFSLRNTSSARFYSNCIFNLMSFCPLQEYEAHICNHSNRKCRCAKIRSRRSCGPNRRRHLPHGTLRERCLSESRVTRRPVDDQHTPKITEGSPK